MTGVSQSFLPPGAPGSVGGARRIRLRAWLGIAPSMAIIGLFMLAPIGIIAVYSFLEANPYGGVRPSFSPEAYVQLLFERGLDDSLVFNDAYITIFLRSVTLAGVATVLCLLIGFPVAYYMASVPPGRRNLLIFLITIPFWTILRIEHVRQNMLNLLERGRGPPVGRRGYVESAPEPGLRAQDHGDCGAFEESCTRCFRVFR